MIFLNYRKIDSTPETRSLKVIFDQVFGVESTFDFDLAFYLEDLYNTSFKPYEI